MKRRRSPAILLGIVTPVLMIASTWAVPTATWAEPTASLAAAATAPVRYVAVSAATVWTAPGPKRPVDAPALSNPAHPRQWVDKMTLAQKRWLSATGAVQTQALYGTKVYVLRYSGPWTKVAVSTQPTPKNPLGYPGWVPRRQLTATAPVHSKRFVVVRSPTASLWSRWGPSGVGGTATLELSYDTHLPLVSVTPKYVVVVNMYGTHRALRRSTVTIHAVGNRWHPTAAGILAESRRFLGLQYLWAGTAGFGYDCSGFTYSVYSRAGFRLPRDASAQATRGTAVSVVDLRPADLLFVKDASGSIVHVVMYYGMVSGQRSVIESAHTGVAVRIMPLSTYHYVAARRYLTG